MSRRQLRQLLDFAKSSFLGQEFVAVGVQDALDHGMFLEAQRANFGMLYLRFSEAHDEDTNAMTVQMPQQRQRSRKQLELADGTTKVGFAGGVADRSGVRCVKAAANFSVNVAQHGVLAESPQARPVDGFYRALESSFDHGSRGRP